MLLDQPRCEPSEAVTHTHSWSRYYWVMMRSLTVESYRSADSHDGGRADDRSCFLRMDGWTDGYHGNTSQLLFSSTHFLSITDQWITVIKPAAALISSHFLSTYPWGWRGLLEPIAVVSMGRLHPGWDSVRTWTDLMFWLISAHYTCH